MSELATVDKSAVSVVSMLEHAKQWLATAVETTGPAEIAAAKAQIVAAETYAKELRLSKDIQLDAAEMVRRAEYALGKAIRKGQEDGAIARGRGGNHGNQWTGGKTVDIGSAKPIAEDFEPNFYANGSQLVHMIDGVEPDQFDAAIDSAKAEGNLSRANLVRKVKKESGPVTRDQRADLIVDLANQGWSSRQMPSKVGVSEERVREIARSYGIDIPADKSIARTRRINSTDVVVNTATALEGLVSGVELIEYEAVDPEVASQWVDSLTDSIRALNRFVKQIKEKTQ